MYGVVNREPPWDDSRSLTVQQGVDVDVDFANGIIGTVSVMIKNSDL